MSRSALDHARDAVRAVRDDPAGRLAYHRSLYGRPARYTPHLPYRQAAGAFMRWQLRRGLLEPVGARRPGSPWWRAVNEALILDTAEARYLAAGEPGEPSSPAVEVALDFIHRPSARRWYRAHNLSVATAYLTHRELAAREGRVERFFLNLVLLRVLYAHALVAAPRLALDRLAVLGPGLGDPRLGMTAIFLSLSRVLPDRYPLGDNVAPFVADEHGFGHFLDIGVIQPRLRLLYDWSAAELGLPELAGQLVDGIPTYAWDPSDTAEWRPPPSPLARLARHV